MGRRISNDWARKHVEALRRGERVRFRPVGGSMRPIIESGQLVEVHPVPENWRVAVGTVVLVQVRGLTYLHLIKKIEHDENNYPHYLIGNNRGGVNGWVDRSAIHGVYAPTIAGIVQ